MIVHLTTTYTGHGLENSLPFLNKIKESIHEQGAVLARDWLGPVSYKDLESQRHENWAEIVQGNLDAIDRCDVLIVEGTEYGFLDGYQVAYALQERKPVLFLMRSSIRNRAVSGLNNDLIIVKQYADASELKAIVVDFLSMNSVENTISIKISQPIYRYLRSNKKPKGQFDDEALIDLLKEGIYE